MLLRELWHAAGHHLDRLDRGVDIAFEKFYLHPHDHTSTQSGAVVDLSESNNKCRGRLRELAIAARDAADYRQARNAVKDIDKPEAKQFAQDMQIRINHRTVFRKNRFRRSFAILGAKVARTIGYFESDRLLRQERQALDRLSRNAENAGDLLQAYGALANNYTEYAEVNRPRLKTALKRRYKSAPAATLA